MVFLLLAAAVFLLDFFIKGKVEKTQKSGEERRMFGDRIILRKYYNKGAILDSLHQWPRLVQILCGSAMLLLCILFFFVLREKGRYGMKLGMALVIGGGASNLYDRLAKGHVVDYFSIRCKWKRLQRIVFNISDWFIFLGAALMLLFHKK